MPSFGFHYFVYLINFGVFSILSLLMKTIRLIKTILPTRGQQGLKLSSVRGMLTKRCYLTILQGPGVAGLTQQFCLFIAGITELKWDHDTCEI